MSVWRTQGWSGFRASPFVGFVPPRPSAGFGQNGSATVDPPTDPTIQPGSPPSSYAVAGVLDGERGSVVRLAGLTMLRGVFIAPGLWVASRLFKVDMTPMQLLALSFGGSATISIGMIGYYAVRRATGT